MNIFKLNKNKEVNVYYFNSVKNFGDLLNVTILENIFKLKVNRCEIRRVKILGIGSLLNIFFNELNKIKWKYIIKFLFNPILIFSTGFIQEEKTFKLTKKILFTRIKWIGVRGKLSQARIKKYFRFSNADKTVLGDAGLLCNRLIDADKIQKKYKVGVILHYVDKDNSFKDNIHIENVKYIDIQDNPINVLEQMAECEFILSSAMHGLIASDALYIPNKWIQLSNNIVGNNYKYKDYYSVYDIDNPAPIDLRVKEITQNDIDNFKEEYINSNRVQKTKNIQQKLFLRYNKYFKKYKSC